MAPELSVVVPVYDCSSCLHALHERVARAVDGMLVSWELVLIDDRSSDDSWQTMVELAHRDPRVRVVRLSRNFGQNVAVTAGIEEARGRWIVVMDCDLQDPPEAIPELYAKAAEGYEIVFGRRRQRRQGLLRRAAGRSYFVLRKVLTGLDLETEHSNLSILSRKAAEAFLAVRDRHRNYLLILYWVGFEHTSIEFEQGERFAGRSTYSLRALLRVGFESLFFHTTALLRWIVYAGFAVSLSSVALAVFFLSSYFIRETAYPGWTSLAVLLLMIGGFTITTIGIAALYVGKVFEQVKPRPLYLVDERVGGDPALGAEAPAEEEAGSLL